MMPQLLDLSYLDLCEEVMDRWDWDHPHVQFTYSGLRVYADWVDGTDEDPPQLTLMGEAAFVDQIQSLANDVIQLWFSETTNNDACDISVRTIAAHFTTNDQTSWITGLTEEAMGNIVVVIARIHDYLT